MSRILRNGKTGDRASASGAESRWFETSRRIISPVGNIPFKGGIPETFPKLKLDKLPLHVL